MHGPFTGSSKQLKANKIKCDEHLVDVGDCGMGSFGKKEPCPLYDTYSTWM